MFPFVRDVLTRLYAHRTISKASPILERQPRHRFQITNQPDCIYAVGDIHGCFDQLRRLEAAIVKDASGFTGSKLIVFLGDYIDRGLSSAAVIDHLIAPPPAGFHRICLCGNHEEILVDVIEGRRSLGEWVQLGGDHTLLSYGYDIDYMTKNRRVSAAESIAAIADAIPPAHLAFLRRLPASFSTPTFLFVHAGLRPGIPLDDQKEHDLLWIRNDFLDAPETGIERTVIYGHTPTRRPTVRAGRIGVDTGAYMGGPLTAVRLKAGRVDFISDR